MGISGSLKDVSVADVMQFIHLGRRTGTLLLSRGLERSVIGFHHGRLVSAQAPRTPKLGDLLVSSGIVDRDRLETAVRLQGQEAERRSLGQILMSSGAIDGEELRQVIGQQIEQAVSEVMIWDSGTFEFAIDDLRPIDDIALYPSDVLPDGDINTQMVLLEAARIFDERNRDRPERGAGGSGGGSGGSYEDGDSTHPALLDTAPGVALTARRSEEESAVQDLGSQRAPQLAAERLQLHIVTADRPLAEQLAEALQHEVAGIELTSLQHAGLSEPDEPPPIVLVDLRRGGVSLDQAAALRRARPGASIVGMVDAGTSIARVYAAGVLAVVPAEVEAVVSCVDNVIETRRDLVRGGLPALPAGGDSKAGVARLRRVFGDLRSGLISATVALNLMHIISESVERAVLFLVKRDHLMALGAFGTDPAGRPLAERTRAFRLALEGDNALIRSLETGETLTLAFEDAMLPESFEKMLGRPRTGQVVVFPVLGAQRVISVIYADNGDREQPIEDIEILELATAQVGMAFENELLRRQISQSKD